MPTTNDAEGRKNNQSKVAAASGARSAGGNGAAKRRVAPSDSAVHRRVAPGDSAVHKRVAPGDSAVHKRVAAGDTSSHKRVSPGDSAVHKRIAPGDSAVHKRVAASDTASHRRVSPGDSAVHKRVAAGDTSAHRRVKAGDTSSQRRVVNKAAVPKIGASKTGAQKTGAPKAVAQRAGVPKAAGGVRHSSPADTTASLETTGKMGRRVTSSGAVGYVSGARRRGGYQPSHAAVKKNKSFPIWIIFVALVIVGVGVGGFFLVRNLMHPYEGTQVADGQEVTVVIPEGSTGSDIVQILLDQGVIHSTSDFKKALKNQNADQSLHSGAYTFVTGSDAADVVAQLVAGPNSSHGQLTVPEGLTITQTANLVQESLGISADEFIAQAKASNYVDDYPFLKEASDDSLEGFLYPKTYDCAGKEVTPDTVIRLMLSQYEQEMDELDFAGAKASLSERYSLDVTNYDILKIASIIEKEAINEDDRPKVSSVFYNRLSQNIAIQSDATMGYVTGGEVSSEDLKTDSPYNTYYYKGLPPTPICNPSLWAIKAAMEPADTPYLFFFIIEDENYSNHTFSETYEEHQEAFNVALGEYQAAKEAAEGGE